MNRSLVFLALLLTVSFASAQESTSLAVTPSDQIRYPDAKDILNPVTPKAPATVKPAAPAPVAPRALVHGWFLVWLVEGDETSAKTWWTAPAGMPVTLLPWWKPVKDNLWEVAYGPLDAPMLGLAVTSQAGQARLEKR